MLSIEKSNSCKSVSSCIKYSELVNSFDNTDQTKSGNFAWSEFDGDIYRMSPEVKNHWNSYQYSGVNTIIAVNPDAKWLTCCMDGKIIIEPRNFVYYDNNLKVDTGQWDYTDLKKLVDTVIKTTKKTTTTNVAANEDSVTTIKGATVTIIPSTLLANDVNTKDTKNKLVITSVLDPIGGSVTMTLGKNSKITFTPSGTGVTNASFKYIMTNGVTADTGTVKVVITQPNGVKVEKPIGKNVLTLNNNIYIEGCSFARVASNMTLITQVVNYFLDRCKGEPPNVTTYIQIPSIPIDYNQHQHYNYTKWLKEQSVNCRTKC